MTTLSLNLDVQYPSFQLKADCTVSDQGITGLYGPSGSGKSSLLRAIAGLTQSHGTITLGDTVWQNDHLTTPTHKRRIGYVAQTPQLFAHLNVEQNLLYGVKRSGKDPKVIHELTDLMGVDHLLKRSTLGLSGGETQRIAIARALATSPDVLLMDEPLSALDTQNKAEILPFLERLQSTLNIPTLYVTHDISELERLATDIIVIEKGQIVIQQPLAEVLMDTRLPFAQRSDAVALLEGTVTQLDEAYNASYVQVGDASFYLPCELEVGQVVRLRIHSRDVSLSLTRPNNTSVQNCLPVTVNKVISTDASSINLKLILSKGGTTQQMHILASVTQRAVNELNIKEGSHLWAMVKGVSLV
jgi:molybdate transport system ATP-binding protein